jgi:glycosyltransferase involved in cell wall biosynthesis
MSCINSKYVEFILVNQTNKKVRELQNERLKVRFVEVMTETRIPAYAARNLGAYNANGTYLFFIDDDAYFYNLDSVYFETLLGILSKKDETALIAQRGEVIDRCYVSHWKSDSDDKPVTLYNFPRYIIEWNLIVEKNFFQSIGGFYNIGPGSKHLAQCGEVFIFTVDLLKSGKLLTKYKDIKMAHPSLNISKNEKKYLLYLYGLAFAVGVSVPKLTLSAKVYWIVRFISSIIIKFGLTFRFKAFKFSFVAFFDGMIRGTPRTHIN